MLILRLQLKRPVPSSSQHSTLVGQKKYPLSYNQHCTCALACQHQLLTCRQYLCVTDSARKGVKVTDTKIGRAGLWGIIEDAHQQADQRRW